jgi:hypothetical protein
VIVAKSFGFLYYINLFERLMAKLDLQMKSAPTANIDTIENCVMFCNNNTISWLQNKDRAEQKLVIEQARKQNTVILFGGHDSVSITVSSLGS